MKSSPTAIDRQKRKYFIFLQSRRSAEPNSGAFNGARDPAKGCVAQAGWRRE
jgi:hypothetical protein